LRSGRGGDLVVHTGGADGEVVGFGLQVPDVGQELPVLVGVVRADRALPVPPVDLGLQFVAAGQQFGGFGAVGVVGVVAGGGQVGGGGFDGGGPLAGRVERAEVLGPGELSGEDVGEGVGGVAVGVVGQQQQFGVGGGGVVDDPAQLPGGQLLGVVDDDQAADG